MEQMIDGEVVDISKLDDGEPAINKGITLRNEMVLADFSQLLGSTKQKLLMYVFSLVDDRSFKAAHHYQHGDTVSLAEFTRDVSDYFCHPESRSYKIGITQLTQYIQGNTNHKNVQKVIRELQLGSYIEVDILSDDKKTVERNGLNLFSNVINRFDAKSGKTKEVVFVLNQDAMPYLIAKKQFISFSRDEIEDLSKKYSVNWYAMIHYYYNVYREQPFELTVELLRERLSVPPTEFKNNKNIHSKLVLPYVEEMNAVTDFVVDAVPVHSNKRGKPLHKYKFSITKTCKKKVKATPSSIELASAETVEVKLSRDDKLINRVIRLVNLINEAKCKDEHELVVMIGDDGFDLGSEFKTKTYLRKYALTNPLQTLRDLSGAELAEEVIKDINAKGKPIVGYRVDIYELGEWDKLLTDTDLLYHLLDMQFKGKRIQQAAHRGNKVSEAARKRNEAQEKARRDKAALAAEYEKEVAAILAGRQQTKSSDVALEDIPFNPESLITD